MNPWERRAPARPVRQNENPSSPCPASDTAPKSEGYSRGYLPHRDRPGLVQMITYRLTDSLPKEVLDRLDAEIKAELGLGAPSVSGGERAELGLGAPRGKSAGLGRVDSGKQAAERRKRIEAWLDAGHGSCALRSPDAAACVVDTWRRFAGERYDLIAWVVMPNHVHVLIRVYAGMKLGKIVQSWKSYTGRRIGQMLAESKEGRTGGRRSQGVWMREYWDRFIRDENHFRLAVEYIHQNPVKAGLAMSAARWPWSSANEWVAGESEDRSIDGMENNLNTVSSTLKKWLDIDADG